MMSKKSGFNNSISKSGISNMTFLMITAALVLIIVLCIGGTVKSVSSSEVQHIENNVYKQQLLTQMRQYLNENGCRNSGVTLTYVTDGSGRCDYTFTIHHKKINEMSEEEREILSTELSQVCVVSGEDTIFCEYLLTEFY